MLPEEGLTSTEWLRAGPLTKANFHKNKKVLVEWGTVRKTADGRFMPAWGMSTEGDEEGDE